MQTGAASDYGLTDNIWMSLPESKLELIGGRLIAGNSCAGSRYLLWVLLTLLEPRAALALAPLELWWQALSAAFGAPPSLATPRAWLAWAAQIQHAPRIEPAGPGWNYKHHEAWSMLMSALHQALRKDKANEPGRSLQRFALRLGDNVLLPDLQCWRRDRLHRLHTYYYDGPADLVIEVTLPGTESPDREVKRRLYAAGGVPEYWIVDPQARRVEFLRLGGEAYELHMPDSNGFYSSLGMPGLVVNAARLQACLDEADARYGLGSGVLAVEPTHTFVAPETFSTDNEAWSWEWRPFRPPVGARPTPISFNSFMDWCPEAKFELSEGKPYIGSWEGTRNVLGMLLCTFGLQEAITLLHPSEWVSALITEETERHTDAARRDAWWNTAQEAALLLRERFGAERVDVVGDLPRAEPLSFWSEITLVCWSVDLNQYELYRTLDELPEGRRIQLRDAEHASARQQADFEKDSHRL